MLDPATTLDALERGPAIYRRYFLFKWRRSLRLKQTAWPDHYDFGALIHDPSLTAMTERMVLKYTDYPDLAHYLRGYAITEGVLESLDAPAHLITSTDDPMIPVRDLARIARPGSLEVTVTPRGGALRIHGRVRRAELDRPVDRRGIRPRLIRRADAASRIRASHLR